MTEVTERLTGKEGQHKQAWGIQHVNVQRKPPAG